MGFLNDRWICRDYKAMSSLNLQIQIVVLFESVIQIIWDFGTLWLAQGDDRPIGHISDADVATVGWCSYMAGYYQTIDPLFWIHILYLYYDILF